MVIQYSSHRSGKSPAGACNMPHSSTAAPWNQLTTGRRQINKIAVLGSGTMGSRIAAHMTNAGLPVVLLDIVPPDTDANAPKQERNKIVLAALDGLKKSKPAAFYSPESARLIMIGNFEDDLALVGGCDWIIEVVAENMEIKRALLNKLQQHRRPESIITSNTSGLPIHEIVDGMPLELRRHWFGTHFFNPPRYMRLLEIIATPDTDPADMAAVEHFCDLRLGKTIVHAHDTPNFIANRIGTFSMSNAIRLMQQQGLTIEEVDTLTGAAIGWPKTGTFRLGDMVGVDVMAHVAKNFSAQAEKIKDERADVGLAPFIDKMLEKKWLGDKTNQGFYKKEGKDAEGRDLRHVLDWQTVDYKPSMRPRFPAIEMAKNVESAPARIAQLLHGEASKDKAAAFYWPFLTELFTYSANRVPEIADNIVEIDQAMKAGYNWELGPFEMFDAAGVRVTTDKMRGAGAPVSANVEKLLAYADKHGGANPSWYKDDVSVPSGRLFFDPVESKYQPVVMPEGVTSLPVIKKAKGVVKKNPGASVVDLGDGVAAIELHSKMNALGDDIVNLITQTLKPSAEIVNNFEAFVITGDS